jgi:hypothetical protein
MRSVYTRARRLQVFRSGLLSLRPSSSLCTIWLLRFSPARWHTVYEIEGKCGIPGGTMKVPYAKKSQNETDNLRKIVLDCDLVEELKWGKPCFTYQKKNVTIIIPLKEACALSFFKGALLKDPKQILQKIGKAQAGRWIKFTSPKEISADSPRHQRPCGCHRPGDSGCNPRRRT